MKLIVVFLFGFGWAGSVFGVEEWNIDKDGLVIHGYDPVAYHQTSEAIKGSPLHEAEYNGAKFLFISDDNKKLFLEDPSQFIPAYGGYCSYGVRVGKKFDVNPQSWKIVNDVLYFQLDPGTQILWVKDLKKNIWIADKLWQKIKPVSAADLSK